MRTYTLTANGQTFTIQADNLSEALDKLKKLLGLP